jgi:orotate phosphoribosyltransferase-like protein
MVETLTRPFADRRAAGRELGTRLTNLAVEDPVVLGLARGGVPVAYEAAQILKAPLDVCKPADQTRSQPAPRSGHAEARLAPLTDPSSMA